MHFIWRRLPANDEMFSDKGPVHMWLQDSILQGNTVTGQGGAFSVVSGQGTHFSNVTFEGNSGE